MRASLSLSLSYCSSMGVRVIWRSSRPESVHFRRLIRWVRLVSYLLSGNTTYAHSGANGSTYLCLSLNKRCIWSTKLKKDIVTSQRTATTTVTRPATAHFSPSFLTSFVSREERSPDADHGLTHAMHRHRGTDGQRTRGGGGG